MKPLLPYLPYRSVRGRLARPAPVAWNVAKTLMQVVVMWGTFFFLLPLAIQRVESQLKLTRWQFASRRSRVMGAALFTLGGTGGLTSAAFMVANGEGTPLPADATRRLVIAGPYRYVRNPMAIAGLAQAIGVGLYLGSLSVISYALVGAVGWNYLVRPWEEFDMEQRFGEPYVRYREGVRCWIPGLQAYRAPSRPTTDAA